jgi:hypothetical protein
MWYLTYARCRAPLGADHAKEREKSHLLIELVLGSKDDLEHCPASVMQSRSPLEMHRLSISRSTLHLHTIHSPFALLTSPLDHMQTTKFHAFFI